MLRDQCGVLPRRAPPRPRACVAGARARRAPARRGAARRAASGQSRAAARRAAPSRCVATVFPVARSRGRIASQPRARSRAPSRGRGMPPRAAPCNCAEAPATRPREQCARRPARARFPRALAPRVRAQRVKSYDKARAPLLRAVEREQLQRDATLASSFRTINAQCVRHSPASRSG